MYYWKDISSPKLFSLTNQILRKYGEEELINFYLSKCKQTIEEIKIDYENGKSLHDVSNDNNLNLRWTIKLFKYYNIHIRTIKENMNLINTKILPEKLMKEYGVTNVFQLETVKQKAKETKKRIHGDENYNNRKKYKETMLNTTRL